MEKSWNCVYEFLWEPGIVMIVKQLHKNYFKLNSPSSLNILHMSTASVHLTGYWDIFFCLI